MSGDDSAMIGDSLIADPHFSNDRAVTIDASPDEIWPWIAQMGFGRAGWYSWDWIDNLGRRSAEHLEPSWMVEHAGDPMPAGPISFDTPLLSSPEHLVLAVQRRRALLWTIDFTLTYVLTPQKQQPNRTILATRARARIDGPGGRLMARWLLGPGDGVMVRKQLRGIADRVQRAGSGRAGLPT